MVYTTDLTDSLTIKSPHHETLTFTTAGPIVSESNVTLSDTLGLPGTYGIMIALTNESDSTMVEDIMVTMRTEHPAISQITLNDVEYGDILAGETKVPDHSFDVYNYFYFRTADTLSGELNIPLYLNIYSEGNLFWQDSVVLRDVVGTSNEVRTPQSFGLEQNYPNPFNPSTTISYQLPSAAQVTLSVYDITGRLVTTLKEDQQPAGYYEVQWDGLDASGNQVSTGVYLCRLDAGNVSRTIKMAYLK